MELPTYFSDFLPQIRLTNDQRKDARTGHTTLRERLMSDVELAPLIVTTFLQGSYRRATQVRPDGSERPEVDVVVVTTLAREQYPDPASAMNEFVPFLKQHYDGKWKPQGRSFGIELSYVDLDLVITSAPSESEVELLKSPTVVSDDTPEDAIWKRVVESQVAAWRSSPLYIPDRDAESWQPTHPLAQIQWTSAKNRVCNRHYVDVVRSIKWWRRVNHPTPEHPTGYPLEHLIGQCCPDGVTSVAEGVTLTLEGLQREYGSHASRNESPVLWDHGVAQNVLSRISGKDFRAFHGQVCSGAEIARRALDAEEVAESAELWMQLLGDKFPKPPSNGGSDKEGGYTRPDHPAIPGGARFA